MEDALIALNVSRLAKSHPSRPDKLDEFNKTQDGPYLVGLNPRSLCLEDLVDIAHIHRAVRYFDSKYFDECLQGAHSRIHLHTMRCLQRETRNVGFAKLFIVWILSVRYSETHLSQ